MLRSIKLLLNRLFIKITPFLVAYPGLGLLRLILTTCRLEVEGVERFIALAEEKRCILMLWHNRLAIVAYVLNKHAPQYRYSAFISKSRDGELLAAVVNSYRQGKAIRVNQQAKYNALREMIKQLKTGQEVMLMTPDGPRGPKYRAKPGIVLAAQNTEACIVPLTWSSNKFWQLSTWDRLILPKPFSKVRVSIGEPIIVYNGSQEDSLEQTVSNLQETLNSLTLSVCESISSNKDSWPK